MAALFVLMAHSMFAATIDLDKAAQVMAAYMRHIAGLTTWPEEKVGDASRPIIIGVLGADPNGVIAPIASRINTAEGLQAQGRPLAIVNLQLNSSTSAQESLLAEIERCDLLFMSAGDHGGWEQIKPLIGSLPIVTVSDMESFAAQGGMIEYLVDGQAGRVRLIVNVDAVKRAGIVLSARLLVLDSVIVLHEEEDA